MLDKAFNFIKGLSSYSSELVKAQPKDLAAAMAFLDSLMDFYFDVRPSSKNTDSSKAKRKGKSHTGKEEEKKCKCNKRSGGNNSGNSKKGKQAAHT